MMLCLTLKKNHTKYNSIFSFFKREKKWKIMKENKGSKKDYFELADIRTHILYRLWKTTQ